LGEKVIDGLIRRTISPISPPRFDGPRLLNLRRACRSGASVEVGFDLSSLPGWAAEVSLLSNLVDCFSGPSVGGGQNCALRVGAAGSSLNPRTFVFQGFRAACPCARWQNVEFPLFHRFPRLAKPRRRRWRAAPHSVLSDLRAALSQSNSPAACAQLVGIARSLALRRTSILLIGDSAASSCTLKTPCAIADGKILSACWADGDDGRLVYITHNLERPCGSPTASGAVARAVPAASGDCRDPRMTRHGSRDRCPRQLLGLCSTSLWALIR